MSLIKYRNLFLRQSYFDALDVYEKTLSSKNAILWDFVIITASNESQANSYRDQINYRLENNKLPKATHYAVLPDPFGKRVGSGGATLNVMKYIRENSEETDCFKGKRILVIHSGGDSKRVPQYSVCGKLFSPVPRELPSKSRSTLFDEFIISMSAIPSRIKDGMLILSGDVLLLFNPLQVDFYQDGAAALTIKENVETGKNHGVFLRDSQGNVGNFLHKLSTDTLRSFGGVDEHDNVDIDTGAVIFNSTLLNKFWNLISENGAVSSEKFDFFVNEKVRLSLYGDFLYPLASNSTLENYYNEKPEGVLCDELRECRKMVWDNISDFKMKLVCLSPAAFIHFGTTSELLHLMTREIENYVFLDWKKNINANRMSEKYASSNSLISEKSVVSDGCYIEDSIIGDNVVIGGNCVISSVTIENCNVPPNVVLHGIEISDHKFVARIYDVSCNPKDTYEDNVNFLGGNFSDFIAANNLSTSDIWDDEDHSIWKARIFPVCDSMKDAVEAALLLCQQFFKSRKPIDDNNEPMEAHNIIANETETQINNFRKLHNVEQTSDTGLNVETDIFVSTGKAAKTSVTKVVGENSGFAQEFLSQNRMSLSSSFNMADARRVLPSQIYLEDLVKSERFINAIKQRQFVDNLLNEMPLITQRQYRILLEKAAFSEFGEKIRIYYYLSKIIHDDKEKLENLCFGSINETISDYVAQSISMSDNHKIAKDEVIVNLPLRVNWGGGWSDTPPFCIENGGTVLNAAIKIRGEFPVEVIVKKLEEKKIVFKCADSGEYEEFFDVSQIQDCRNTFDPFALHKAALIVCGVIPFKDNIDMVSILDSLGGGIYLSTCVKDIPRGSGLGTSSILSGACVKGLFDFLGKEISDSDLYDRVLCLEQLMSTGGGWQDQVGGLTPGIKVISSDPGIQQAITCENIKIAPAVLSELQSRFCLIYTGQRRLARNLLREVVGRYISSNPTSVQVLDEIQRVAVLMRFELEKGEISKFAQLFNRHWELSKQLDIGCTNTCIDQIFLICEDMIEGKMICGAGGGGFLQVILKKQYSIADLSARLRTVFGDTGVDAWDCEFV